MAKMACGLLVAAAVVCMSRPALAQETIVNWEAPHSWSPPAPSASKGAASTMAAEAIEAVPTPPLPFVGLAPCRLADTRGNGFTGQYGPPALVSGVPRTFVLTNQCGISPTAQAVSLNVTVTNTQGPGHIVIYPAGGAQPTVSTLNYVAGQTIANAAVVPLGTGGAITVVAGVSGTDLILDTNGDYRGGVVTSLNGIAGNVSLEGIAPVSIEPNGQIVSIRVPGTLPPGTVYQTLRHDGSNWVASSALQNKGTSVAITGVLETPATAQIYAAGNRVLFSEPTGTDSNSFFGIGAGGNGGVGDTAIGFRALYSNGTNRVSNIAVGSNSLFNNASGDLNIAIGNTALSNVTGGNGNIGIGQNAGFNVSTGNNNIYIGSLGFNNESGQIRIGDANFQNGAVIVGIATSVVAGSPVLVTGGGRLGVAASSARYKENIHDVANRSDGILKLRPVSFHYKPEIDPAGTAQYGLIAEEVARVYPELVGYDEEGRPQTVRYDLVNVLLLDHVQKQQHEIEELRAAVAKLQTQLSAK